MPSPAAADGDDREQAVRRGIRSPDEADHAALDGTHEVLVVEMRGDQDDARLAVAADEPEGVERLVVDLVDDHEHDVGGLLLVGPDDAHLGTRAEGTRDAGLGDGVARVDANGGAGHGILLVAMWANDFRREG